MARPLLRSRELRQRIDCYFSSDEQKIIRTQARDAGLPLSSFIRRATIGVRIEILPRANVEIWQDLAHTSANLNQIAHHLNSGQAYGIPPDLIADLASQVQQLRLQLIGADK